MDYFYDSQVRRYLLQYLRVFSDIKVRSEPNENGLQLETRVPIKHGDMSRLVASILNQNTENVTISAPTISGYISSLKPSKERRADPQLVSKVQADEVAFDELTGEYGPGMGNRYTVERYMPVPYDITFKLDILTTNNDTKLQILEQILTIFNPSIQLTQNENPLDWTSVFELELTDMIWSNRQIPVGVNMDYDIVTLDFSAGIWINPPAKEKRQRIIKKIITRIYDTHDDPIDFKEPFSLSSQIAQVNVTPGNLKVSIEPFGVGQHKVQLLNAAGAVDPAITWESQIRNFGSIALDVSQIKLKTDNDIESDVGDIYATIVAFDTDPTVLIVEIDTDTLPATIPSSPVTQIIDPLTDVPGDTLPVATAGQKYLIIQHTPNGDPAILAVNPNWSGITAANNSIIEYTTAWGIVFDSTTEPAGTHVVNSDDGQHYKFTGTEWIYTFLGEYNPVYWELINLNPITP